MFTPYIGVAKFCFSRSFKRTFVCPQTLKEIFRLSLSIPSGPTEAQVTGTFTENYQGLLEKRNEENGATAGHFLFHVAK